MRTSISKKLLAGALSVMMVLSLFAGVPANKAQAASYSLKQKNGLTKMYSGSTYSYNVNGVEKGQYIKISRNYTSTKVTAKENGKTKTLKAGKKGSLKLNGTGKQLTFKATLAAKDNIYTNKVTVKVYSKAGKVVKTLTKSAKVYKKTTAVTLDKTEATLKVGETATLTATKTPAKCTRSITWATSDASVATVEGGVVTAVAPGTATITAKSGAKTATATITVEAKEAELVDLKVTGSKKLTATLSATAEVAAADLVVKKGTVTLTPADVTVDGTNVVITLASKLSKDTYSVTYKEKTLSVEAEDEKLVEFKTVGTALAQAANDAITPNADVALDGDNATVNATINYQALNQYGEPMNANILSVTSTFGGAANYTEPTAKKDGTIYVYNIAAALGIVGTEGNIIIVSKDGVSSTCKVTMSETAKVKEIKLAGIWSKTGNAYVDAIPAEKAATNFALVIDAYDQYERPITNLAMLEQTISQAQVMTNVKVVDIGAGKLDKTQSFETVEVNGVEKIALKLEHSTGSVAKAGTLQVIVVGDRFGSVMNETVKVEQIDLIKSFTFAATDTIYNKSKNVLSYSATSASGKEVTDYDTLKKLVEFGATDAIEWARNTDGTAKLVYKPNVNSGAGQTLDATNENMKQSTILSATATCNAGISAGDQIVVPKTFTVYEEKKVVGLVKYTGATASADADVEIYKSYFVYEDQYGNSIDSTEAAAYSAIRFDYEATKAGVRVDLAEGVDAAADVVTTITQADVDKLYISIADQSDDNGGDFDKSKAQLTLTFAETNAKHASNLTATCRLWEKKVAVGDPKSGVVEANFKVTGTVNGKKIVIPTANYTIVNDTYEAITSSEYAKDSKLVKKATVTINVVLADPEDGTEYTETLTCDYEYSAAPSYAKAIYSYTDLEGVTPVELSEGDIETDTITTAKLSEAFTVLDQYQAPFDTKLALSISFGEKCDNFEVKNPNTTKATITNVTFVDGAEFTVTASVANANGLTATQDFKLVAGPAYAGGTPTATIETPTSGVVTFAKGTGSANAYYIVLEGAAEAPTAAYIKEHGSNITAGLTLTVADHNKKLYLVADDSQGLFSSVVTKTITAENDPSNNFELN